MIGWPLDMNWPSDPQTRKQKFPRNGTQLEKSFREGNSDSLTLNQRFEPTHFLSSLNRQHINQEHKTLRNRHRGKTFRIFFFTGITSSCLQLCLAAFRIKAICSFEGSPRRLKNQTGPFSCQRFLVKM